MNTTDVELINKILMDGIQQILLVIHVKKNNELAYEFINQMALDRTNLTKDSVGQTLREVHTKEEFEFFRANHLKVIHTKKEFKYEDTFQSPQGDYYFSETRLTPLMDENEKVSHIVVLVHDITDKKRAEMELGFSKEELIESRDQFRIIAENSHDLISLISQEGYMNYVSPSSEELLGIRSNEFIGKPYTNFIHPEEKATLYNAFDYSVTHNKPIKEKYRMRNSDGNWLWFELHGSPVFNEHGEYHHFVVVSRDITTSYEYESKLKYFAYHDVLTDLPNRRSFMNSLTDVMLKQPCDKRVALLLLDIDQFKRINDENGHDIGDLVITEFARRLRNAVQSENGSVARLGGDEFAVVLPAIEGVNEAIQETDRILLAVREPWIINNRKLVVTVSIGLAVTRKNESVPNEILIKNADLALYEAKNAGKNCFKLHA